MKLISAMTHNVVRQFQITTGAVGRANGRKHIRWIFNIMAFTLHTSGRVSGE